MNQTMLTIKQASMLCQKHPQTIHYWISTGLESEWVRKNKMAPQHAIDLCDLLKWLEEKGKKNVIETIKENLRNYKVEE